MLKPLAAAGLLALTVATLGVASALAADEVKIKTKTTLNVDPTASPDQAKYSGRVNCKAPKGGDERERKQNREAAEACEGDRSVTVIHVGKGDQADFTIGTTKTADNGKWQLFGPKPPAGDTVRADVASSFEKRFDATCKATSKFAVVPF